MSHLQQKLESLLGNPVFAETTTTYQVAFFDPLGAQKGCQDYDCQDAADDCARIVTRDHPELSATIASSDSLNVYVYEQGECRKYYVEAEA